MKSQADDLSAKGDFALQATLQEVIGNTRVPASTFYGDGACRANRA